ncbi:protein of unknown function [Novosphingobium sp. CF614]|uniref:Kiwa anti-phage protein KwaB-like domain-containing protein n=1 Tax=Novosphingobium sp. CF614 TaxID=1884364 RepID=UPI0008E0793D|nr:Kiwa anti-phage protein KwaB-like domain-containing protein [Novosphingobium sp. CF614]SFG52930.1 protein of unknown function [Novosphingobium sp. CF614]
MAELADLHAFDLDAADLTIWVYKQSTKDGRPVFNGRWIGVTDELAQALRAAVAGARSSITETIEYQILAQNNESSALTIGADETYIALVKAQAVNPVPAKKVTKLKDIANTDFYAIRFATENDVLLAVRKTDASWSTKKSKDNIRMIFSDDELDIDVRPSFSVQPFFDFFSLDDRIFVSNKGRFESVLAYRAGHVEAFEELKVEPEFAEIFADVGPITIFVGSNKIQLRRAIAIREKAHYKDPKFMDNLRAMSAELNLNIEFEDDGRIRPTAETCRDIFQALLDHRLDSRLSEHLYDVQSTQLVG